MAKFKSELSLERMKNEMRNVEVEINFTSNALASILYRQGETVILACVTKADSLPRWFPETQPKDGFMQNIAFCRINRFSIQKRKKRCKGSYSRD